MNSEGKQEKLLMKMMENLGGCQADPMKIFAQLEEKDRKKVR